MNLLIQQILNGLVIGSTYGIVALGFGLVFTVLRVINFAHPQVFMIGMFSGLFAGTYSGGNIFAALGAAVIASALTGLILDYVVLRPLRERSTLMTLIGTLGAGIMIENAAAIVFGTDPVPYPQLLPDLRLSVGQISLTLSQASTLLASLTLLAVISFYVRFTRMGRATRAIAENPTVAAAFGINVDYVSRFTVILSSALAGAAAVSVGNLYGNAWAYVGLLYGLKSFICMLVAGDKHIEGIAVVALGLGVVEALVSGYISSSWRDVAAFGLLMITLMYFPGGIFGSYSRRGARP